MKIIGLDLGSKTCGIAQSDPKGIMAFALTTIEFPTDDYETAVTLVEQLCQEMEVEKVVVGMPKHLSGEVGERGRISQIFADILAEDLGIEVVLWDERYTTKAAEKMLITADVSRQKRKKVIDKIAATYILQGYLDSENNRSK